MKTYILFLLTLSLFFISSCKDDDCDDPTNPLCSNYDACLEAVETSADFYIYANLGFAPLEGWRDLDADTVFSSTGATFTAKYKEDKYTWLIGAEVLEDHVISRQNFPQNEDVTFTLITENFTPNTDCFPMDNGKDTLSRTFFADARVAKISWEGKFIGSYNSLPDEEHQFTMDYDSFFVYGLPYDECQHRLNILNGAFNHNSVLFRVYDILDQTGRCSQSMKAFMTVDQDSFWLNVIGPESNTELNGQSMKGIKLN